MQGDKRKLAIKILDFVGFDILIEVRRSPRWKDDLMTSREKLPFVCVCLVKMEEPNRLRLGGPRTFSRIVNARSNSGSACGPRNISNSRADQDDKTVLHQIGKGTGHAEHMGENYSKAPN
jgi:hypothetical protein